MSELDGPTEYLNVPSMVVQSGGNPKNVFKNRAQIRSFVMAHMEWNEDECTFCYYNPDDYDDLETEYIVSRAFGNFEVNLCNKCINCFPYFIEEAIYYYWELPDDS